MVGNDIVDLAQAKKESDWQRPRFLEKLFTQTEQQFIQHSENKFQAVWLLWSMKEAAYKLYTQLYPSRFYNPKAFECTIKKDGGKVSFKDFECYTNSKINSEYILSEGRLYPFEMQSKVIDIKEKNYYEKASVTKEALLKCVLRHYTSSKENLVFWKTEFGIPTINFNSKTINVSLSHHGNFGAYVYSCPIKTEYMGIA